MTPRHQERLAFMGLLFLLVGCAPSARLSAFHNSEWTGPWNALDVHKVTQEFAQYMQESGMSCRSSAPLAWQADAGIDAAGLADSLRSIWNQIPASVNAPPCQVSASLRSIPSDSLQIHYQVLVTLHGKDGKELLHFDRLVVKTVVP